MAEAEKQGEKTESMEEILQSIKKIMDDGTGTEATPAAETDVFDLTNVVKEEKPMVEASTPAAPKAAATLAPVPAANSEDVAKKVESVFSAEVTEKASGVDDAEASLMSEYAASAAAAAFKKITDNLNRNNSIPTIPSPITRSGNTVEELILEALRPMLKEWLDKNLPIIVQKIVEREVKRVVTYHYD